LADPASPLMTSPMAGNIDTTVAPSFQLVCPVGMFRGDGAADCEECPGNAIPDPATKFKSCKDCVPGRAPDPFTKDRCVCARSYFNSTSNLKCYEHGQNYQPDAELPPVTDVCMPCTTSISGCVDCNLEEIVMHRGYSLAENKLQQGGSSLNEIRGQRSVFPCPGGTGKLATCTGVLTDPCEKGYTGVLCSICDDGWSRKGLVGTCHECYGVVSLLWIVAGGGAALAFAIGVLYWVSSFDATAGKLTIILSLWKIALSLVQIISQLAAPLQLQWPPTFQYFIDLLKVFSFDLLGALDVGCLRGGVVIIVDCTK